MSEAIDISTSQRKTLLALLRRFIPGLEVWAYGSRAKWTARPNSDLDLVAFTSPEQNEKISALKEALAESDLPFLVDLHVWSEVPERFHEIIRKEYVVIQEECRNPLPDGWRTLPLEECMAAIIDYRGKTPTKTSFGVPLVTAKIVKGGRIEPAEEFIAESDYESWMRRGIPEKGDVVMTTEAPLGEVAQLDGRKVALAQRVITLRGKPELLDNGYLRYLLQSTTVQDELKARATGTTVLGIKQSELRKVQLTLPPLSDQKFIARILSSLDDKIELNRQICATLEAMAQALFKSWFVDFDPVKAKASAKMMGGSLAVIERAAIAVIAGKSEKAFDQLPEIERKSLAQTAALFPDSFKDSELGEIPTGWDVRLLPEVTTFREGPGILAKDFHPSGVPLIRLAGLKNGVSLLDGCDYLDPSKVEKKWNHFRLLEGDILLSTSASLGRVAEVSKEAAGAIPYTGIIGFRPIAHQSNRRYIYHFLSSSIFQNQVESMGVGSVLKHFGPYHLNRMVMLRPSMESQARFCEIVSPMDAGRAQYLRESANLTLIRNTLLPKLLSGEGPTLNQEGDSK